MAFLLPLVGSYIDFAPSRKKIWSTLCVVSVLCICGTAVIGRHGVWLVGLICSALVHVARDTMWLAQMSYLPNVAEDDPTRARLGGMKEVSSFGAQISWSSWA